ncbi:leucine-rich repeat-containing G-protein coupled receptor: lgr-like protein [Leptotrombidium deliense]|uniref:Leucine-rich repeat-containing G-protein coupled receptor: lgr-like protein n=1 Tax=Leptotrombidium deliense TaxID=299467 RepID=A0A443SBN5_9ACAR|nr:leucine-rich repeat-containing G-protein coupled receptor: lgr-like protein [Leptotrombidium deliense]
MHLDKILSLKHACFMSILRTFALIMTLLPLISISDYCKIAVCLPFETNCIALFVVRDSKDSRIAKRMALLEFNDFLHWAPIAFFTATAVAGYDLISLSGTKVFILFILLLNSCANPFLYAIFTKLKQSKNLESHEELVDSETVKIFQTITNW